jgi:hypothetical protein
MKRPLLLSIALTGVLLASCKPEKPEDVLEAYLENVNHGEFDEAIKYVDEKSVSAIASLNMTPVNERLKMMQKSIDVKVTSQDVQDSIAYLKVKLVIDKKELPESSFALKKEEGEWKVVMSERIEKMREAYENKTQDSTAVATIKDSLK